MKLRVHTGESTEPDNGKARCAERGGSMIIPNLFPIPEDCDPLVHFDPDWWE
jgi:hypothetical protein